jgi:SARP family transcriptional regulator, regulator of embCAB operon
LSNDAKPVVSSLFVRKHGLMFAYRVRVLGAIDLVNVTSASTATAPLAPKHRHLLALLASQHGEWIGTDVLIEELWEGAPVSSATKTLQGFVFRLRQILGAESILNRRGSYALNPQLNTDRTEFLQLVAELDLFRTQPTDIVIGATRAESLWRGDPFSNVPATALLAKSQQPLREMRGRIQKTRIDALLQQDQAATVVSELHTLVASEPLREDYWALLVRALYLSGSAPDAFAAFGNARRILASELGLEPGPMLQGFQAAMLRADRETLRLGLPPGPSE